ncbi:AAA-ATPase ASD, mitochondrial-like [Macadamia integrifolia]|uniref:AAA-ATPase ASD, mitochondrial-like n=1 Tax=Macadamia integrifolia TaxID=60698 RepID=UPI001C4FAE7C|nr:AAA-ATPase ASD, mitochondrial-like [Macadamia integrifolia]
MMKWGELWTSISSTAAAIMFGWAIFQQYIPYQLRGYVRKYFQRFLPFLYPNIHIAFHEYTADRFKRSEVYSTIEAYLSSKSSKRARRLKADAGENTRNLILSMDEHEQVTDEFQGVKLLWSSNMTSSNTPLYSFYPPSDGKRYYTLTFHKRYRDLVTASYLNHIMEQGKAVGVKNRQRKLHTNNKSESFSMYGYKKSAWSHVVFDHPATFRTLAMEPQKKKEIMDDLINFSNSKDYYRKIGKAWKRGYLLYGPPGTGKSSMIAAMANLLDYDIYDLELTSVKDNTELRKLLIETSSKSIIVIEDIDCSLDLTGQRTNKKKKTEEEKEKKEGEGSPAAAVKKEAERSMEKESKVTLSGLLNFIDGLWSACGVERLIVFTTNYVEKLDPALIRRGRMDKHIELSYCSFEGFKVFAKNYLDLDSHPLFETIQELIKDTQITPADVAENLMPKSFGENAKEDCLEALIRALQVAKEEARVKAEEALAEATREEASSRTTKDEQEKESRGEDKEGESTQLEDNDAV